MAADADLRAPGAVTRALCGHWEHEPPCPLAPHHTWAQRRGDRVQVRTLFVVEPERAQQARDLIVAALSLGRLVGPDGACMIWQLESSSVSVVRAEENAHAERLARS